MPYALFTNDEQISKAYDTRQEVWRKADEAGLVVEVSPDGDDRKPERVLDEDYSIKPCPPDSDASLQPESMSTLEGIRRRSKVRQD
ncbi:MAG: hypothetical protein J0G28_04110 [Afipia sp.]|nr:hypothetical protein [Afipia sp.]OJW63935.1 MAG: hypothetical protein BGO65_04775 [Afipia sp. 64-13]